MTSRMNPAGSGDDHVDETPPAATDIFAGLTPIDVIEGELVPRQS